MKKWIKKWAMFLLLTVMVLPSFHVSAASEIDFEQGSMSDEEYVRHVLTQFNELDGYRSEMLDEMTGGSTVMIYDKAVGVTKITTHMMANAYTDEMTIIQYVYDDGTMVSDEVAYLESSIPLMSEIYPEFETQVEELRAQMGDKLVIQPPMEGAEATEAAAAFVVDDIVFSEVTKEGDVVKATLDEATYLAENPVMAQSYPENTKFLMLYTIDPAAGSVTSTLTIDVDEDAVASEESSDEMGISLAAMMSDMTVNVVVTATDEKVPSLDELPTITDEEYQQLLTDIGIEAY